MVFIEPPPGYAALIFACCRAVQAETSEIGGEAEIGA
jgi:hypothetical protein